MLTSCSCMFSCLPCVTIITSTTAVAPCAVRHSMSVPSDQMRPCLALTVLADRLQSKNDDLSGALEFARNKAANNATALSEVFHYVATKDAEVAALKAEVAALKMEKADAREAHAKQLLEAEARGSRTGVACIPCDTFNLLATWALHSLCKCPRATARRFAVCCHSGDGLGVEPCLLLCRRRSRTTSTKPRSSMSAVTSPGAHQLHNSRALSAMKQLLPCAPSILLHQTQPGGPQHTALLLILNGKLLLWNTASNQIMA